ncbi:Lipoxygenase [Quillaja saponaria]|uniref:Lipoxygenase n=1 Tax=Quillaja saponaria TaxID=32244 RepID=A0AAD7PV64_QUISA|nr:Lipoxygenase [Quillaja saponaria]
MMAMSNETPSTCMVKKSHFLGPFGLSHKTRSSSSPHFLSSGGKKLELGKKVKQTRAVAVHNVEQKPMDEKSMTVKLTALVTVRYCSKEYVKEMMKMWSYILGHQQQRGLIMQLVSTEVDPRTMEPKMSKEAALDLSKLGAKSGTYRVEFQVDSNFGLPGAVTLSNRYDREFFLESINIEEYAHFECKSWVQPNMVEEDKRIFFTNKAYLPSETPMALKEHRENELRQLRGEGRGIRLHYDRIYDYDVYN